MDASQFITAARTAGSKPFSVTFNNNSDGITALRRLSRAYCGEGRSVSIRSSDRLTVSAVIASGYWEIDANRTIHFIGLGTLDNNVLYQFARDIEKAG